MHRAQFPDSRRETTSWRRIHNSPRNSTAQARLLDATAEQHRAYAEMIETAIAFRDLATVLRAGDAGDVASHPDLAELNVQLDGYYGHPGT
jgi:hypothetical protein